MEGFSDAMALVFGNKEVFNNLTLDLFRRKITLYLPGVTLSDDRIRLIAQKAGLTLVATRRSKRTPNKTRDQFRMVCRVLRDFAISGEFSESDKEFLKQIVDRTHTPTPQPSSSEVQ